MSASLHKELGPYRLDTLLGRGGMGEVYKAWDQRLERWVAVKRLRRGSDEVARSRLRREARAAAQLGHPAIVQVFDVFENEDGDWIVMQLVDGPDLAELLRDGPLDTGLAIDYGRQVASGLEAAHAQGIVHRDLKTENVMVLPSGHVKILDFGLVKLQAPVSEGYEEEDLTETLTRPGWIVGTPRTMSPEQTLGAALDTRSDLFAFGVLLYELVTARSPFEASSVSDTLNRVRTHRQPPARQLNPRIPQALSEIIDQLLEKDPDLRPQSAGPVKETLARIAADSPLYRVSGTTVEWLRPALDAADDESTVTSASIDDAVVRTLLVSDLVESTKLVTVLGDRGAAALFRRHDRLARDLLSTHEGREIDKTDGFLLLFERPWNAVCYALDYHRILRELSEEIGVELRARVGIHLGAVILRRNPPEDVSRGAKPLEVEGLAKPTAARLSSLARGGQTLLTRGAFEVARRGAEGEMAAGLEWHSHGLYRFKGLDDDVDVFEVVAPDGEASEAPPGTEKARRLAPIEQRLDEQTRSMVRGVVLRSWPPPELPEQPYPVLLPYTHPELMAGRGQEIAELRRLLRMPVPVLGLAAPSGTGKSSLLLGGLVPTLRADGKPVALTRHPHEKGVAGRLLADLLDWDDHNEESSTNVSTNWQLFVERLLEVERLAGEAPVLVLDQFEELLRPRSQGRDAEGGISEGQASPDSQEADFNRAILGVLLAATARRRPGIDEPMCRWLLAYRQEFHGKVIAWLRDVLSDAREDRRFTTIDALPHDLSHPERFHSMPLAPLARPSRGADALASATRVFQAAIETPLQIVEPDGAPRYRWSFAPGHAERLAEAFAESRLAHPDAPLTPELQVVLAHLLARAVPDPYSSLGARGGFPAIVEVPDDAAGLIEEALENHLHRALEQAFPGGRGPAEQNAAKIRRSRALLALRELATASGQRDEGIAAEELARAIGEGGDKILEKLATPLTRLVVLWEAPGGYRYVLSHDRMAEVVVHMVEQQGARGKLLVDADLLALRQYVELKTALYSSQEEQATRLSRRHYRNVEAHAEALLWDDERRAWWRACRKRRRRDQQRTAAWTMAAMVFLLFVAWGAWSWARQRAEHQVLLRQVVEGEPETALVAVDQLTRDPEADRRELLSLLRRRETAMDVLAQGLGGLHGAERGAVVLRTAELVLPWVEQAPRDAVLLANLLWALDFAPGRDPRLAEETRRLRGRLLDPWRGQRPPPALASVDWVDVPAGSFRMGTAPGEEGLEGERPQHEVTVSAFRMMAHEVTNAQYRRLDPEHPGEDDLPASYVSWYEAYTYAAWLGGRLPTEAEWEYAARAGCGSEYCVGDGRPASVDEVAWTLRNARDPRTGEPSAQAVKGLEPNPWDLYDTSGNVWEWTADWRGDYSAEPQVDPWGPAAPLAPWRVPRGGCFRDAVHGHGVADRASVAPAHADRYHGFRVVLPGPSP